MGGGGTAVQASIILKPAGKVVAMAVLGGLSSTASQQAAYETVDMQKVAYAALFSGVFELGNQFFSGAFKQSIGKIEGSTKFNNAAFEFDEAAGNGKVIDNGTASTWADESGNIIWPLNGGAVAGTEKNVVLTSGFQFDRYGYNSGTYVSPVGTPFEMRSLAPGTELKPYKVFEVVKPVRATGSIVAPWFGQPGGGIQFELENSINQLLELNWIKEILR